MNVLTENVSEAVTYSVVYQELSAECGETVRTYGVQAHIMGNVAAQVLDISTDSAFVHKMAKKFTEEQLLPCHLHDVVCDLLDS